MMPTAEGITPTDDDAMVTLEGTTATADGRTATIGVGSHVRARQCQPGAGDAFQKKQVTTDCAST